ncbi:acetyl-CoA synthetase-like protein [Auriculariales sp. MPI-PUGE-AT-0066]|nr:acetyl-CoA synthetase-like protein [Auriculariales sp. MPI-PUGE-AT-0066]
MAEWLLRMDTLTYTLGVVAAGVFIATKWMEPMSMVPPLILGRQSDAGRTRQPGESAVYRNYGTGFMSTLLPARPHRDVQTINNLLKDEHSAPRTLWGTSITNAQLKERATALASGLLQAANLTTRESRVLILLNDSLEWLLTDLALGQLAVPSVFLAALDLLHDVLEQRTASAIIVEASFLEQVLEVIAEESELRRLIIVVVGEPPAEAHRSAQHIGVNLLSWQDVEARGRQNASEPVQVESSTLLSICFHRAANNEIQATQFTHENFTAGVVATHFLLPYQNALSPKDSVVSAFPLATPFGRSVLYSALYNGASFTTVDSAKIVTTVEPPAKDLADILAAVESQKAPSPTVLVVTRQHLNSLTKSILSLLGGPLKPLAWRHKSVALAAGSLTNDTLFDRIVFDSARRASLGQMGMTLRAVIVSGGQLDAATLPASRIALSVPIVNAFAYPLVAGPVFGSHPLDVQAFPAVAGDVLSDIQHFGPPTTNIEVKLVNVSEEEGDKPVVGNLHIRGPAIGTAGLGELRPAASQQWVNTYETAAVQTNGSFKILPQNL